MTPDSVTINCPAKVNLALSVARLDGPSGMHPLSSWMVAIDFCDTLTVGRLADGEPTRTTIRFATDAPRRETVDWPIESDLAVRAHAACEAAAGRPLPVDMNLLKRIPTGGGLGGGSSDAAGMLVALDRLFDQPLPRDALADIARRLGSDVPFALAALTGTPSAVVTGFGETVVPAPTPGGDLSLLIPPFGCDTRRVYHAHDCGLPGPTRHPIPAAELLEAAATGNPEAWRNDLATPACVSHPALLPLINDATEGLGRGVHVSGSGSSCFIAAENADHAHRLTQKIRGLADVTRSLYGVAALAARYPFVPPPA